MLCQANIEHLPLKDESVGLVFTDPPYLKEHLSCYQWLAAEAMRVLKWGGFLVTMAGNLYLNRIYRTLDSAGLSYFYNAFHDSGTNGGGVWVTGRTDKNCRVVTPIKMFVCYSKGKGHLHSGAFISAFRGIQKDKLYHHWGQDVASARYFIDFFSSPGDLVCDPFLGGGTTAVACELIGRQWVGCDIDPAMLRISNQRLSDEETAAYRNLPMF